MPGAAEGEDQAPSSHRVPARSRVSAQPPAPRHALRDEAHHAATTPPAAQPPRTPRRRTSRTTRRTQPHWEAAGRPRGQPHPNKGQVPREGPSATGRSPATRPKPRGQGRTPMGPARWRSRSPRRRDAQRARPTGNKKTPATRGNKTRTDRGTGRAPLAPLNMAAQPPPGIRPGPGRGLSPGPRLPGRSARGPPSPGWGDRPARTDSLAGACTVAEQWDHAYLDGMADGDDFRHWVRTRCATRRGRRHGLGNVASNSWVAVR